MEGAKKRSIGFRVGRVLPRATLLALVVFAGLELAGPRVIAPARQNSHEQAAHPTSRPTEFPEAGSRSEALLSGETGSSSSKLDSEAIDAKLPPSNRATDPVGGALYRQDVYRAMRQTEDPAAVAELGQSLIALLGEMAAPLIGADFCRAIENDEPELIAGAAHLLGGLAREEPGAPSPIDDRQLDTWIDFFALSDAAAAGICTVFLESERIERAHFDAILAAWRSGLAPGRRTDLARRLLLHYAEVHRDAAPYLELLGDPDLELERIAIRALCLIDSARYSARIVEFAAETSAQHRSQLLSTLVKALPKHEATDALLAWHERWPGTPLTNGWVGVGFTEGEELIRAYRVSDDPKVRRQILIGWSGESLSPQAAEKFLTEVYDTDPDRAVRAQTLLALGQVDHERARARLAEAMQDDDASDVVFAMHLSGGVRNAVLTAPSEWVERYALPYAVRRIRGVTDRQFADELSRWQKALDGRFPERARQLAEEVSR